jgi:DNA repair protein RadC
MAKADSQGSIKHWPQNERPRERLLKFGPKALSHAELLAILLRTGIKGKSARRLARELLQQFGGLRGLYSAQDSELMRIKGLGPAKIAQLRAAIELSKRYVEEELKEKHELTHPQQVFELLYHTKRDLPHEEFSLILLNGQNRLIEIVDVGQGSLTSSVVYPREVIKLALKYAAASLIFAHNHPSGNPKPSPQDKTLTQQLVIACQAVGIQVLDHIVIGNNRYYSFTEAGLMAEYKKKCEGLY